jgi:hypothetical protein
MRLGSYGASILLHALVLGLFVVPGTGRPAPRALPEAQPTPNVTMLLLQLDREASKPVEQPGTIQYPHHRKKPPAKAAKLPPKTPVKVAAKPSPKPTPTPTPAPKVNRDHKIFEALRKFDQFKGMTDEQIRKMPLPPGMKSWQEVLAMNGSLDKLDWTAKPPDTGQEGSGSATASFGFQFGWAPPAIGPTDSTIKGTGRQLNGRTWQFAYQYLDTMIVAAWPDGVAVATVAYYPAGGKPDQAKTFQVAVKPAAQDPGDGDLIAAITTQYLLIKNGLPPQPVPSAANPTH